MTDGLDLQVEGSYPTPHCEKFKGIFAEVRGVKLLLLLVFLPCLMLMTWIRCALPVRSFNGRLAGKHIGHQPLRPRFWHLQLQSYQRGDLRKIHFVLIWTLLNDFIYFCATLACWLSSCTLCILTSQYPRKQSFLRKNI